ncbi:GABA-specific high-affinity permease [Steccherinum ochraceum]|uniref:GABA-specific high-affinity permease n=1 Tax=Steccherinum ochraceum TaxID=92696 RepID=A0A4R0RK94_9APHY|nr:GABA-specific high-affinity permease [Steccherinum ochraceum]
MAKTQAVDKDAALLATLGYKQDFKRTFSRMELFGVGFSIIGVFPSVAGVLIFAIPYGGPVAMVWGWALCGVFVMCIASTVAELGSAAPTAGGLYYWTYRYASPRTRNLLSWVVGYMSTMSYATATTAVAWACAVSIMAGASIGTDFTYVPTTGQTFGVFTAVIVIQLFMASLPSRVVAQLQSLYIALNILICLGVIIALPIATPKENINTGRYVFGTFVNLSGWPAGFAFILSFLSPLWTIAAFDAPAHISEEASNASYAVPFATLTSPAVAVVLGWGAYAPPGDFVSEISVVDRPPGLNVSLAFCMGTDLESVVGNQIRQPLATILFNSFGKKGTLAVWSFTIVVQMFMGAGALTSGARLTWAFSRDEALPFSRYISRLNPVTGTPTYAAILTAVVAFVIGLLVFAGPAASTALFSASLVSIYVDLTIVILCRLLGGVEWVPGPFTLGKFSRPIAWISVIWMTLVITILCFPANPAPNATNMNYTSLLLGGYALICVAYYYLPVYGAKRWFQGPVRNIDKKSVGSVGSEYESEKERDSVIIVKKVV